jgi:Fe-S oxidoreductase
MSEPSDVCVLNDVAWEEATAATKGAAAPCFACGVCTAVCPWGLVQREPVNVRKLIRRAQLGLDGGEEAIWLCTTCGACEALCPRGVPVSDLILSLRGLAWKKRKVPKGLPTLLWAVHRDGNPWSQPPSRREEWAKGLDLKPFSPSDEALLYVGCTAAYDRRSQKIARSLVGLLRAAGVSFGILPGEPCCGESVRAVGHEPYLAEVIEANVGRFREAGVGKLVAISPHCLDMFRTHYPAWDGFVPLHYTEYLAELLEAGRLHFSREITGTAAYHDPCYLGRRHGIYDPPRKLLAAIPGLTLVEMASAREDALCCGGGGGRMWLETHTGERFGDLRIREAEQAGAEWLVTSCPFCVLCLEDSVKVLGAERIKVVDLTELAARALGGGE